MEEPPASESPQPALRILAANLPALLAEQLRQQAEGQTGVELRWFAGPPVELLLAAGEADVLLYGAPNARPLPPICTHLLAEFNELRIVVVLSDGSGARLYWLGLRTRWLGKLSDTGLLAAARSAASRNQVE